jgi:transposase-like protein
VKRLFSGLLLPITALACLGAWWALMDVLPQCVYCESGGVRHAPRENEPYRYQCDACKRTFTHADGAPVGFLDALDAMSRRSELYAD